MGVTAFIPAKMTSRRLPKKNMCDLCGQPLLYYSVKLAQLCGAVDRVVVCSESEEVCRYAENLGAASIPRPEELSQDHVPNTSVLKWWYDLEVEKPKIVALLQPTHPLRHPDDLDCAARKMLQESPAVTDTCFAVVREDILLGVIKDDRFVPEFLLPRDKSREPARYRNTGSFYLLRPERTFLTGKPYGSRFGAHILQRPEFEVDIDEASDLEMARCLLQAHRKHFSYFDCA